ncbi:MAG: beta-ketoacyl-ACP synthase II [Candidatus Hydrothermae bacterium]|nr:beta-ketoacyl-ACP synthase II [Candidatus Hydrothermae bacterium]
MNTRRVVITGMGAITPLGDNVKDYFEALLSGKNGITRIERFDPAPYPSQIAGEIKDFEPTKRINPKTVRRMDRFAQYALYATQEALEDSGLLDYSDLNLNRVGVYLSSGIGGIEILEKETAKMMEVGPQKVSPFLVPMMIPDIASGQISIEYGFKGPNFCIVSACASSTHSIGESFRAIRYGSADVMIAGGAEAPLVKIALAGFSNMRALSTRNSEPDKASRPFDKNRDGFVMSEGSGVVVLESLEHAEKRGAKIYAEILGYGATADAYHITAPAPEGEGAYQAMKLALADAGLSPDDIDYVNAHGTSTQLNDKFESIAIKRLFGERAYRIPISSTKSMIGHLLGAAGGVEVIATVMSIIRGKVHMTRNFEEGDEFCDLDYIPEGSRDLNIRYALKNSFGFGGHNASLVIGRFSS